MFERTEAELLQRVHAKMTFCVYIYTPLCGTCKVAERMLEVVGAMRADLQVDRVNIHVIPSLVRLWQVESVPCLIKLDQGQLAQKMYAFESVENVLRFLEM